MITDLLCSVLLLSFPRSVYPSGSLKVISKLLVHSPEGLKGEYDHKDALFGINPIGGSLTGEVFYAGVNAFLCDRVDPTAGHPVRPDSSSWAEASGDKPFILMVDRGQCPFSQKVENAEAVGAAAVVVANNVCECSNQKCLQTSTTGAACENTEPCMADDERYVSDVVIPSFLVPKLQADSIKEELMADHPVEIEMSWPVSKRDHIKVDIWSRPGNFDPRLKQLFVSFGDIVSFSPHMSVLQGHDCEGGRGYCTAELVGFEDQIIASSDMMIIESLRQLCIWNEYSATDSIGAEWWDYILEYGDKCSYSSSTFSQKECIQGAYDYAGVEKSLIDRCMQESGGTSGGRNSILDVAAAEWTVKGPVILDSTDATSVNDNILFGDMMARGALLVGICGSLTDIATPPICECTDCLAHLPECLERKKCPAGTGATPAGGVEEPKRAGSGVSGKSTGPIMLLIAVVAIAVLALFLKRRFSQNGDVPVVVTPELEMT